MYADEKRYRINIEHLGKGVIDNEPVFEWTIWDETKDDQLVAKTRCFETMNDIINLLQNKDVKYLKIDIAR